MTSQIKRSVTISGHRTSITLEQPFWDVLKELACMDKISVTELIRRVDAERDSGGSLTSALRVYILERVQTRTSCS